MMPARHFFRHTPSFFALRYFGPYQDYRYPKGGTGRPALTMAEYIQAKRGEICCDTGIVKVNAASGTATTAAGESFHCREPVWAADAKAMCRAVTGQPAGTRALPLSVQPPSQSHKCRAQRNNNRLEGRLFGSLCRLMRCACLVKAKLKPFLRL